MYNFLIPYLGVIASHFAVGFSLLMAYKNMSSFEKRHSDVSISKSTDTVDSGVSTSSNKGKIMPLYEYLKLSIETYNEFSEFLTSCFALENLIFFVKAVVFRRIISNIVEEKSGANTVNESTEIEMTENHQSTMDKVCGMEFKYLDGLILKSELNDDKSVHDIAKKIEEKYISVTGEFQVNISADVRETITDFLRTEHHAQDYLHLFDGAVKEVYEMLVCIYQYRFKSDSRYRL